MAIHCCFMTYTFSLAFNPLRTFRITKKRLSLIFQAFNDFFENDRVFQWKNGALRWRILVGKQKHNVQLKHVQIKRTQKYKRTNHFCRT